VRVADRNLADDHTPSGLEHTVHLSQRGIAVGDLPKRRDQYDGVEGPVRVRQVGRICLGAGHVRQAS